jgi:YegS/Rv2252/BmrU family lipid kinase
VDRPEHLTVILNPAASGGRGGRLRSKVERALTSRRLSFDLHPSEAPGHARVLAGEAAARGTGLILVVGGDGTIHEVANGILGGAPPPPPVAVAPVGTGNDFFRMLSSRNLEESLDSILGGETRMFDVGLVRHGNADSYFVNLLGVGLDVEVLRRRAAFPRLRGLPQYLAGLFSALASFRPLSLRVTVHDDAEGQAVEGRTLLTAVTVGPSVGGGFLLNPDASPEDGLLDLFFVKPLGILKLARYIPKVIRGTHQGVPELLQRQLEGATIARSDGEAFFFEMDGELMDEPVTSLDFRVVPGLLPVRVPRSAE